MVVCPLTLALVRPRLARLCELQACQGYLVKPYLKQERKEQERPIWLKYFRPERELIANKLPKARHQFKTERQLWAVSWSRVWWHTAVTTPRSKRKQEELHFQLLAGPHSKPVSKHLQELCEFEASLGYTVSSMPAWVFQIKIIDTHGSTF